MSTYLFDDNGNRKISPETDLTALALGVAQSGRCEIHQGAQPESVNTRFDDFEENMIVEYKYPGSGDEEIRLYLNRKTVAVDQLRLIFQLPTQAGDPDTVTVFFKDSAGTLTESYELPDQLAKMLWEKSFCVVKLGRPWGPVRNKSRIHSINRKHPYLGEPKDSRNKDRGLRASLRRKKLLARSTPEDSSKSRRDVMHDDTGRDALTSVPGNPRQAEEEEEEEL